MAEVKEDEQVEAGVEVSHLPTSSSNSGTLVVYIDGERHVIKMVHRPCYLPLAPIVAPGFDYDRLYGLFCRNRNSAEIVQK